MSHPFQLIDVFGNGPFSGNPLAVVLHADDIADADMQAITRWLNYSETTFLLRPTDPRADYRVRIFTLERELPFAGHPTLGTCHAWLSEGGKPQHASGISQQCGAGLVTIRQVAGRLAFAAPPLLRSGPVDAGKQSEIAEFLRLAPSQILDMQWADNGPGWVLVMLDSADAVLALQPQPYSATRIDVGVVGPHPAGADILFELRAFFTDPHGTVREDPVTGSLNASAAQYLFATGRAAFPYIAAQGTRLGRHGRIYVQPEGETIWIGGDTKTLFEGKMKEDVLF